MRSWDSFGVWGEIGRRFAEVRERSQQLEDELDRRYGRKDFYTVPEAADFWEKHPKTVYRWARTGEIKSSNRGQRKTRISRTQVLNKRWEILRQ